MQTIIYSKYSIDRADRFKIKTDIRIDDVGKKTVYKTPYSVHSNKHIESIYASYKELKEFYKNTELKINECNYNGQLVSFPFLDGKTLEEFLDKAIEEENVDGFKESIEKYCNIIRGNSHCGFNRTKEFEKVFGSADFSKETRFVNVANIDLLFSNIIVNDCWNMIDYEWTFLFDVPADFIIYRALSNFINGMFDASSRTRLKDQNIFEEVGITEDDIKIYQKMDCNFASYVIGNALTGRELQETIGKPILKLQNSIDEFVNKLEKRTIQVFFDFGKGFLEENSIFIMPSWNDDNVLIKKIDLPKGCIAVRIDPMIGYGFFQLYELTLDNRETTYEANGICLYNNVIVFYNDDPQIIIQNTLNCKQLKLEGKIIFTEKDVSTGIIAQCDEFKSDINNIWMEINRQSVNLQDEFNKSIKNMQMEFDRQFMDIQEEFSYNIANIKMETNGSIESLKMQLDNQGQRQEYLESYCQNLEHELRSSFMVRFLKSHKITYKIGKALKFLFKNGPKATVKKGYKRFKKESVEEFKKEKVEINEGKSIIENNVYALGELEEKGDSPGLIAVHLHLFYIDLLPEFIWYMNNIPFEFDLFISCQMSAKVSQIQKKVKKIKNVRNISIRKFQNRGRDIAPLYAGFRDEIMKYDYFLHMHTKKSLYTGEEKIGWRQMSLDSLLGSEEIVRKIFGLMESKRKIGLVYPEYYQDFCKFHCSWLTNEVIGREFLEKLDIEQDKMIFNYPVGSFFWAKTDAIMPLFDIKLEFEDFPEEQGQVDTTLAHVLERAVACVAEEREYVGALIDLDEGVVRVRKSLKLFDDYMNYSAKDLIQDLEPYQIVSFDIFGTLIDNIACNRTVFYSYIAEKNKEIILSEYNFVEMRKRAEKNALERYGDFTKISQIYECLIEELQLNKNMTEQFIECEINALLELCVPRKDMQDIYHLMRNKNKKIILIEDTYYTSDILNRVLSHCGYDGYEELWISNEYGKRKDKDELWDDFYEVHESDILVHVGDNPRADWQTVYDRGKSVIWIMNGYDEFCMSKLYDENLKLVHGSYEDMLQLGALIHKKYFNSPFALKEMEEVRND